MLVQLGLQFTQCDFWAQSAYYQRNYSCIQSNSYDGQNHLSKYLFLSQQKDNQFNYDGFIIENTSFKNSIQIINQSINILEFNPQKDQIKIYFFKASNSTIQNVTIQGYLNLTIPNLQQQQKQVQIYIQDFNLTNCNQQQIQSNIQIYINNFSIDYYQNVINMNMSFNTSQKLTLNKQKIDIFDYINKRTSQTIYYRGDNFTDTQIKYEFSDLFIKAQMLEQYTKGMLYLPQLSTYYSIAKFITIKQNQDDLFLISCNLNETYMNVKNSYYCYQNHCEEDNQYYLVGQCVDSCQQYNFYQQDNYCKDQCDWYESFYANENNQCIRCDQFLHNETQICNDQDCSDTEIYYIDYQDPQISYGSRIKKYSQSITNMNKICLLNCGNSTQITNSISKYNCIITAQKCQNLKKYYYNEMCFDEPQYGLYSTYYQQQYLYTCQESYYFKFYDMKCSKSSYLPDSIIDQNYVIGFTCFSNNFIINNKNCVTEDQCLSCNTFKNKYQCQRCQNNFVYNQETQICDLCSYKNEVGQCIDQQNCTHYTGEDIILNCQRICYNKCPDMKYYIQDTKQCVTDCNNDYQYKDFINDEIQCIKQCQYQLVDSENQQYCIQSCNSNIIEYITIYAYKCIDQCDKILQNIILNEKQYHQCVSICNKQFLITEQNVCSEDCEQYVYQTIINDTKQYTCQNDCDKYTKITQIYDKIVIECKDNCTFYLNEYECTDQCQYLLQFNSTCVSSCNNYFVSQQNISVCLSQCDQFVVYNNQLQQYQCQQDCNYYQNHTQINNKSSILCQYQCQYYKYQNKTCVEQCQYLYQNDNICVDQCPVSKNISTIESQCIPNCQNYVSMQEENYQCLQSCNSVTYDDIYLKQKVCINCNQFYGNCSLSNTTCINQNQCETDCQNKALIQNYYGYFCVNICEKDYKYYQTITINNTKYNQCVQQCDQEYLQFIQENQCVQYCDIEYQQFDTKCYLKSCQNYILEDNNLKQSCVDSCSQYVKAYDQYSKVCKTDCKSISIVQQEYECNKQCQDPIKNIEYNKKELQICQIQCNGVIDNLQCKSQCNNDNCYIYNNVYYLECQNDCNDYLISTDKFKQQICTKNCNYNQYQFIQNNNCVQTCANKYKLKDNTCTQRYKLTYVYIFSSIASSIVFIAIFLTITIIIIKKKSSDSERPSFINFFAIFKQAKSEPSIQYQNGVPQLGVNGFNVQYKLQEDIRIPQDIQKSQQSQQNEKKRKYTSKNLLFRKEKQIKQIKQNCTQLNSQISLNSQENQHSQINKKELAINNARDITINQLYQ